MHCVNVHPLCHHNYSLKCVSSCCRRRLLIVARFCFPIMRVGSSMHASEMFAQRFFLGGGCGGWGGFRYFAQRRWASLSCLTDTRLVLASRTHLCPPSSQVVRAVSKLRLTPGSVHLRASCPWMSACNTCNNWLVSLKWGARSGWLIETRRRANWWFLSPGRPSELV